MSLKSKEIIEREKKILELRADHTLKAIGEMFGITKERVRQIEAAASRRIALSKRFKEEGPVSLESDIERLELSIRTENSLRKSDINTVRDIIETGLFDLLKIKSLGRKCIQEIRDAIRHLGFRVWNI